jgi:hypothetical protein
MPFAHIPSVLDCVRSATPPQMTIAYVAYTEGNVLMLDSEGVCLRVEPLRSRMPHGPRPATESALRCIGAQFVASIDPTEPGGLAHLPRVGTSMLFAAVDQDGRIYCVRAGPLTHFEATAEESRQPEPVRRASSPVHGTPKKQRLAWEDAGTGNGSEDLVSSDGNDEVETWVRETPLPTSGNRDSSWLHEPGPFNDTTDPGFSVSFHEDSPIESEPETAPYPSTRYSQAGHRFSRSTPIPPPPPPPRLPRIQATVSLQPAPQPSRHVPLRGTRPVPPQGGLAPAAPRPYAARPPAPSSHAWLRSSPVAERRWR